MRRNKENDCLSFFFLFCTFLLFCERARGAFWCADDLVCNVLYNVNRSLCKTDHDAFCEGPRMTLISNL